MIPRVGPAPDARQSYVLRPGAYAILPLKNRFLLTAQIGDRIDIQLPGGGIDSGENTLPALHREVLEETGWHIARPRRMGAFRRFAYMPEYDMWAEKLCHVYVARPVVQVSEPIEPNHETLVLSGSQAIKALGNDGDRSFMARYVTSVSG
ncbi:MAG: NUDIX domain-containing protein [Roseobacter sp.]